MACTSLGVPWRAKSLAATLGGSQQRLQRHRVAVCAQAPPPGGCDAVQQRVKVGLDSLERLFLSEAIPPPSRPAHLAADVPASVRSSKQQQHKRRHKHRQHQPRHVEVCSKLVCVEHEEPPASVADVPAARVAAPALPAVVPAVGPDAYLAGLLEWLPFSPRTQGIIMLNVLVILVATNWVVVKDVGNAFDPLGFATLRFLVAAAAFSPFMAAATKDSRIMRAGMELGLWTAAGYISQSLGLLTTDASRASFLSTFTVLVVPFLAGMSGKGVSPVTWASCFAALLGVGLLEQNGAPPGVGDVWSMLSAVAFGVQLYRTEHWARILGNGSNLPLMSVVLTTTMGFSAAATGVAHFPEIVAAVQHPETLTHMFGGGSFPWWQVLYCGLLTTDLALLLELLALQNVSSVDAAIIYTLEPVLGATLAWGMLGERLGPLGMVGAAVIVASSLATQLFGGSTDAGVDGSTSLSGGESDAEGDKPAAKLASKQE